MIRCVGFDECFYILKNDKTVTPVYLSTIYYDHDNIVTWLEENCRNSVTFHCAAFMFEDSNEALLFKLRWSEYA